MKIKKRNFFLVFLVGFALIFPGFYGDQWGIVQSYDYWGWQTTSERVIVARLAKSTQDGVFSAGGLFGLLDAEDGWAFGAEIANHQYEMYRSGASINYYLVYKSHPGFQGLLFGVFDSLTAFTPDTNLKIFRGFVAFSSAAVLALVFALFAVEFGLFAAIPMILFTIFSEWMILPAGSLYWNLWVFYLPMLAGMLLLAYEAKQDKPVDRLLFSLIFITSLMKILFTGFELITTSLVMSTVPFVYFFVRDRWSRGKFYRRMTLLGIVLSAATVAGLGILAVQITANDGSVRSAINYIRDTLDRRALGNPDEYRGQYAESLAASTGDVILKYLNIQAVSLPVGKIDIQIYFWQLVALFAMLTLFFASKNWNRLRSTPMQRGVALVIAVWYSAAAPLSWFIVFKATAYIHTFLFPMAWEMPFILIGLALSGYVIQDAVAGSSVGS